MTSIKFEWNSKKNELLKNSRKISFEKIVYHLSKGDVWKIADHPDQEKYSGQKIYFVIIDDYKYLVPYIEQKDKIFLKTIIPSRKATKIYKKEIEGKDEN